MNGERALRSGSMTAAELAAHARHLRGLARMAKSLPHYKFDAWGLVEVVDVAGLMRSVVQPGELVLAAPVDTGGLYVEAYSAIKARIVPLPVEQVARVWAQPCECDGPGPVTDRHREHCPLAGWP